MLNIVTLGDFDIIVDDRSILEDIAAQRRIVKLFKYFLIQNNIKLLPEDIIEDLWGDEDFKNPLNLLRAQISRLRKIADANKLNVEPLFTIEYINGYYIFCLRSSYVVDFIEFERVLEKDFTSIKNHIKDDYLSFKDLFLSYKGKFYVCTDNRYL